MRKIAVFFCIFLAGCYLPDNRDHSACAPEQTSAIQDAATKVLLTDADGAQAEWVPYSVISGRALVEADILIGAAQELDPGRSIVTLGRLWRGGVVPYRIHPELKNTARVHEAMANWEKITQGLIRFVPVTNQYDFVEFVKADGCWSSIGRTGGRQEVGLAPMCGAPETTHEIGHLLGLWHEQSRADRDAYVEVKWCNIDPEHRHNFFRRTVLARDYGPYDYGSIMHYPRGAFSNNNRITLKSRSKEKIPNFNGREISVGDLEAIRFLYL